MHYTISESCPVSTAGPGYYVIPSGARSDKGLLCRLDLKPGDTLDVLKAHSPNHDKTPIKGLVFVKFREDDNDQVVFKKI